MLSEPEYWDKWINKSKRTLREPDEWFILCKRYEKALKGLLFEDTEDVYFEKQSDKFTIEFEGVGVYNIDNGSFNELYYKIEQAINNGIKLKLK